MLGGKKMKEKQADKETEQQPNEEKQEQLPVEQGEFSAAAEQAEVPVPKESAENSSPVEPVETPRQANPSREPSSGGQSQAGGPQSVEQAQTPHPIPASTNNGMAIAALILGVVSIALSWFPMISYVTAILAIVFGFIGMKNQHQKSLAIVGVVLGFLTFILKIGFWVLIFIGIASEMMYY